MRTGTLTIWLALLAPLALGTLGCQATKTTSPLITSYDRQNTTADLDFWDGLANQRSEEHTSELQSH